MAHTSTPERRSSEKRSEGTRPVIAPRRSTLAIIRQIARLYNPVGSAPLGIFIAN